MATITAQSIIDKAEIILQDTTNVRWPENELLGWLNDAQREIVLQKPDSYAQNESMSLESGTKQTIPSSGIQLLDVTRNMGTDGSTAGNVVRLIDRRILDDQNSDWHSESQSDSIQHYCFDDRDPKTFYVYPPADGTTQLEIVYSSAPTDVSAIEDTITLDDIYSNAILDYILYRAYQKDAGYAANNQRAITAYKSFLASLGKLNSTEAMTDPMVREGMLARATQE